MKTDIELFCQDQGGKLGEDQQFFIWVKTKKKSSLLIRPAFVKNCLWTKKYLFQKFGWLLYACTPKYYYLSARELIGPRGLHRPETVYDVPLRPPFGDPA